MLFIRHNKLLPPFDDYHKLDVAMLDDLASGRVSPSIADLPVQLSWASDIEEQVRTSAYFVCSSAERTQQTCRAVMARFGIEKEIIIDRRLDEIAFVPSQLMLDTSENPLAAVRARLYSRLREGGKGVENSATLQNRINMLLQEYKGQSCTIFSHGFLMRLIVAMELAYYNYFNALDIITQVPHVDYLAPMRLQNV